MSTRPNPAAGAPSPRLSDAIAIARVVAIFGMVYVHAWTGLPGWQLHNAGGTMQGVLRWTLVELLGRSAVPLLGMISGWLVMSGALSRPWGRFVAGKARVILLPMLMWNAIAIVLVSGASFAGLLMAPRPPLSMDAFGWLANELFSLTRPNHINVQTPFLRDLFVCMLAAPLLARLSSRALAGVAVLVALWAISGLELSLLLRPSILLFFICGMLVRRGGIEIRALGVPLLAVGLALVLLAALRVAVAVGGFGDVSMQARVTLDLLLRFAAALAFWRVAWMLAGSRLAPLLLRVEPFIFLMFCCHLILIWFGGPAIGALTGPLGAPFYPLFLIVQPALVLAASIALGLLLSRVAPGAARVLSGGRLGRVSGARAPAAPVMAAAVPRPGLRA